ncbi:MAG: diadenylate cyclase CdaA [Clostridia bacterium]|nr:diadenylate cyclase CdaA [Clostridia bacterium]
MQEFFEGCLKTIQMMTVADVIDIIAVSVLIFYIYAFLRDRRAGKLVLGVVILVALKIISDLTGMYVMQFILQNVFQVGFIIIAIVFQPELRSVLEKVGGQPIKGLRTIASQRHDDMRRVIDSVAEAAVDLSETKTGALIVIERETKLGDLVLTGTVIDAEPSPFLIRNVFFNKAPLHDGALIIRNGRLYAAGCLLPLSMNSEIIKDLGTRHRAAIGMSENSDAVVVVVSEETGTISLAVDGVLTRGYDGESLRFEIAKYVSADDGARSRGGLFSRIFRKKNGKTGRKAGADGQGGGAAQ